MEMLHIYLGFIKISRKVMVSWYLNQYILAPKAVSLYDSCAGKIM